MREPEGVTDRTSETVCATNCSWKLKIKKNRVNNNNNKRMDIEKGTHYNGGSKFNEQKAVAALVVTTRVTETGASSTSRRQ